MRSCGHVLSEGPQPPRAGPGEVSSEGQESRLDAIGVVSPHAGYVYSGEVAATGIRCNPIRFSGTIRRDRAEPPGIPDLCLDVPWETPLGIIDVDPGFSEALDIKVDEISHQDEHSLEVQMPFIKFRFPGARIRPGHDG